MFFLRTLACCYTHVDIELNPHDQLYNASIVAADHMYVQIHDQIKDIGLESNIFLFPSA